MAFSTLNSIFTPGWSTSKAGDMKNPGSAPVQFAKTEPKPGPFTTAIKQAEIERRQREQQKLREDFLASIKSGVAQREAEKFAGISARTIVADKMGTIKRINEFGEVEIVAAPKADAGKINGLGIDFAIMDELAEPPAETRNPDRPQTAVDAW